MWNNKGNYILNTKMLLYFLTTVTNEKYISWKCENEGYNFGGTWGDWPRICFYFCSSQWRQPSLDEQSELGDINADLNSFRSTWTKYIQENKQKWKERAASGEYAFYYVKGQMG